MKRSITTLLAIFCVMAMGPADGQTIPLIQREQILAGAVDPQGGQILTPYNSATFPHDWTEGTGMLGSGGEIDIPAVATGKHRRWILIQNQSSATITVKYEGRKADGVTQSFISILLGAGGTQGGSDERGFSAFVPQGQIKIIGTANAQAAILEVVE